MSRGKTSTGEKLSNFVRTTLAKKSRFVASCIEFRENARPSCSGMLKGHFALQVRQEALMHSGFSSVAKWQSALASHIYCAFLNFSALWTHAKFLLWRCKEEGLRSVFVRLFVWSLHESNQKRTGICDNRHVQCTFVLIMGSDAMFKGITPFLCISM